jgi:hypothetical protein
LDGQAPLDNDMVRAWIEGILRGAGVRAALRAYATADDLAVLDDACQRLATFERPTLSISSPDDRVKHTCARLPTRRPAA